MINSDNNWYVHKKTPYSNTYPSTYDVHAHMISPKHVLVHIRDDNYEKILFSTFVNSLLHITTNAPIYHTHHIRNGNIFRTQYKIVKKHIFAINTVTE